MDWLKERLAERTSHNGIAILAISIAVIVAAPLAKWLAYAGLAYGVYSIWKLTFQNSLFNIQKIDLQFKPNYQLSKS